MKGNSTLSFEDFDYGRNRALLPEEYEPIPYVGFSLPKPEKLVKVIGYPSVEAASKRLQELIQICPSDKYQIMPNSVQTTIQDYALIIPEAAQEHLNKDEAVAADNPPIVSSTLYAPILYRFLGDEKYENNFFEKGELLISSFKRCRKKEIKDRQDAHENQNKFAIKDGSYRMETVLGFDFETLLLCTSLSQVNLKDDGTPYEHGFRINNSIAFFEMLTRALVTKGISVCEILMGPCVYNDKLISLDATGTGLAEAFLKKSEQGTLEFAPMMHLIFEQAQNHILMNKPTNYAAENEYRHVWKLSKPIKREEVSDDIIINQDGSIIVCVPELIQFCERLS